VSADGHPPANFLPLGRSEDVRLPGCRPSDNRAGTTTRPGGPAQYALLIYNRDDGAAEQAQRPVDSDIAAVLARPDVTGWTRLHAPGSATTVSHQQERTLLTDGPFIDSKEFLGGVIVVEADNLDGALAIAGELAEMRRDRVAAIEVRPLRGGEIRGA
jgi:hypothetical protein